MSTKLKKLILETTRKVLKEQEQLFEVPVDLRKATRSAAEQLDAEIVFGGSLHRDKMQALEVISREMKKMSFRVSLESIENIYLAVNKLADTPEFAPLVDRWERVYEDVQMQIGASGPLEPAEPAWKRAGKRYSDLYENRRRKEMNKVQIKKLISESLKEELRFQSTRR